MFFCRGARNQWWPRVGRGRRANFGRFVAGAWRRRATRSVFDKYLEAEWPKIRKEGAKHSFGSIVFFLFGLSTGLFLVAFLFYMEDLEPEDLLTRRGAGIAYFAMGVVLVTAYVQGRWEWTEREERYKKTKGEWGLLTTR